MKMWQKLAVLGCVGMGTGYGALSYFLNRTTADSAGLGGGASGELIEVDWGLLRELDLESGKMPGKLKKIDGGFIKIPGFIVPLEDNSQAVTEFLLVPSPTACVHTPPPPANQMIHVKMASGRIAKMAYGPVWLKGRLRISDHMGPFGKSSYEMVGDTTEPYVY